MEDFVTIQIARKLKEKGFKEECLAFYTNDDKNSSSGKFVDVPTISQALKWLRKKKKYHITVEYIGSYSYDVIRITDSEFKGGGVGLNHTKKPPLKE